MVDALESVKVVRTAAQQNPLQAVQKSEGLLRSSFSFTVPLPYMEKRTMRNESHCTRLSVLGEKSPYHSDFIVMDDGRSRHEKKKPFPMGELAEI